MGLVDEFAAAFGVWDIARPYLHLMVDEAEMTLVVRMAGRAVTVEEAADLLGLPPAATETLLQRAYARHILNKKVEDGTTRFTPADFPTRLDHFAKFENWDDIPEAGRRALDRRFLDEFIARHRPNVERKTQGLAAENALPNDTVLLLHEVEAMLDAASDIIVQPCDCRRLGGNCDRPVETCIWLDAGGAGGARPRIRPPPDPRGGQSIGAPPRPAGADAHRRQRVAVSRPARHLQLLRLRLLPLPRRARTGQQGGLAEEPRRRHARPRPLLPLRPVRPALPLRCLLRHAAAR
jgi:hypothetical protein